MLKTTILVGCGRRKKEDGIENDVNCALQTAVKERDMLLASSAVR